jgi:tetratricopeptide (TPR) repeat protein
MLSFVREAFAQVELEEYEKACAGCLRALDFRTELQRSGLLEHVLYSLSAIWLLQERYGEVIAFFSQYIERYPDDAAAYTARAGGLWYLGQLKEAVSDYSRALELKPSNIVSLSGRGQVLAEMGNHEKCLEDLDLALRALQTKAAAEPDWSEWCEESEGFVRRGRGVALAGLGKKEAAIEEFGSSLGLNSENAWGYYSRAQFHDAAGNYDQASSDYQMALMKKGPSLTPIQREHAQERLRVCWLNPP